MKDPQADPSGACTSLVTAHVSSADRSTAFLFTKACYFLALYLCRPLGALRSSRSAQPAPRIIEPPEPSISKPLDRQTDDYCSIPRNAHNARSRGNTRTSAKLLRKNGVSNVFLCSYLLSVAVMTYSYVYHPRSLRPMMRLICYAHSE